MKNLRLISRYSILAALSVLRFSTPATAAYSLNATYEVPTPPTAGSNAATADYAELHRLQNNRTHEECDIAATQSHMDLDSFFGPAAGILTETEFRAVTPLLMELKETVNEESKPFKEKYTRARPYNVDATISPCVEKPSGATSYPSSHAAMGITMGHVLADLIPAKRAVIEAQGIQIGENRLIGGVHHPSDVKAGRDLGDQIYDALRSNAKYQSDFRAAKASLR